MSLGKACTILGKPDAVRPAFYIDSELRHPKEIVWYYGAEEPGSFGTLAEICFDKRGRVRDVAGNGGVPPKPGLFTEPELRRLLRLLNAAPELIGGNYNPLPVIRIVNILQPLGKEKALAAIREYARVCPLGKMGQNMFLVLRVLFDIPKPLGYMPPMLVGSPSPMLMPAAPLRIPRFPIILYDDVPFLVVTGYNLAGFPQPVTEHIDYFAKHGTLRSSLLHPPDKPVDVLSRLEQTSVWIWASDYKSWDGSIVKYAARDEEEIRRLLRDQLLRLLDTVYPIEEDWFGSKLFMAPQADGMAAVQTGWTEAAGDIAKLDIEWNPQKQLYTFRDGSYLKSDQNQRQTWKPRRNKLQLVVTIYRRFNAHVVCELDWLPRKKTQVILWIYPAGRRDKPLAEYVLKQAPLHPRQHVGCSLAFTLGRNEKIDLEAQTGKTREGTTLEIP